MALQTDTLKEDLKNLYRQTAGNQEQDEEAALDAFCNSMAGLFEKYVKTAAVVYSTGLVAGPNPVTGTFTHSIE